mgnify:CR=1 FL=1
MHRSNTQDRCIFTTFVYSSTYFFNILSMRKKLLIVLFLGYSVVMPAQNSKHLDSLKRLLPLQKVEAARMQVKIQIGDYFEKISPDSAQFWYKSAIPANLNDSTSIFEWFGKASEPEKYLISVALARHGIISLKTNKSGNALENVIIAYKLANLINQPSIAIFCSDNLAIYYAHKKDHSKAIIHFENSLGLYKLIKNSGGEAYCLSNLGVLNAQNGNYGKAAEYFSEQISITDQNPKNSELLQAYLNIATLYQRSNNYENAKQNWIKALSLSEQLNRENYSIILAGLGNTSFKTGDLDSAIDAYTRLQEFATQASDNNNRLVALSNLAMIYTEKGENSQAIDLWTKTLGLAESCSDTPTIQDALLNLSNINMSIGNHNESAMQFDKYISIIKQNSSQQELAEAYLRSGKLNDKSQRFDKSKENYREALKIYESIADNSGIATTNLAIAKSFIIQGQYSLAIEFANALVIQENKIPQNLTATAYQTLAEVHRLQLLFHQALDNYQKALTIWQNQANLEKVVECLNTMGSIYETTGNLPMALNYCQQALDISIKNEQPESTAAILNNIGVVYRKLGDNAKAKDSYQKALDINIQNRNTERIAYCYNNIGVILEQEGKLDEAILNYHKSIELKEQGNDKIGLSASLLNLGNAYKRLKKHNEANELFLKALSISQSISDKQGEAFAYGNLSALKLEQNDLNASIGYSNKNLEIAKTLDLKQPLKEAYRQLAWAYENTNSLELAEEHYRKIIETNQQEINANFSILSENEKELFFKTVSEDYDRFYAFACKRQQENPSINNELYNTVLRNKGLLLKSSTAMRTAILASNNSEVIGKHEQWIALKQAIAQQYSLPSVKRSNQLQTMENTANDLERDLVKASAEFSEFHNTATLNWADVKAKLTDDEVAIEFIQFKQTKDSTYYAALIINKNSEHPIFQNLFEEKKLEKLLGSLTGNNLKSVQKIYGTLAEDNDELYNLVWKPLEKHIKGYSTIYYSPSGLLHKISFAAISKSKNQYLIDDYNLRLVSTTANAGFSEQNQTIPFSDITLFGGIKYNTKETESSTWKYLPGTLSETEMIEGIFMGKNIKVTRLTDTLAKEEVFKSIAPKSSILHIATHGFFYPDPDKLKQIMDAEKEVGKIQFRGSSDTTRSSNVFIQSSNPLMRSGLVFARANDFWGKPTQSNSEDGVLTALEVLNIDLRNNRLTVMSACETGLGDIAGSEGVYGLQRAFRMAGSSKLIMSLWQVPDAETAEFMKLFYTSLLNTANLRESFNQAQKLMRQKYDPYFWAAFVLLE